MHYLTVNPVTVCAAGQGQYKACVRHVPVHNASAPWHRRWESYDAAVNVESYTGGFVRYYDVCQPWPMHWFDERHGGFAFDWIVTVEMAEHIPPYCSPNLLSLLAHARKGVIMSWGDTYIERIHVNPQPEKWVLRQVDKYSKGQLVVDHEARVAARNESGHGYLRHGLQVFRRVNAQ